MAVRTLAQLRNEIATLLRDNATGDISAADVRQVFLDTVDSLEAVDVDLPAKATNADVDAETDDVKHMSVRTTFRAIARRVKNASETVRGIVFIARNVDVDASETDLSRVLSVLKGIRLFRRLVQEEINRVPSTPGTDASIGHVLTVTGTNDRDYAWREFAASVADAVAAYLRDNPPQEEDDVARRTATDAEAKADANRAKLDRFAVFQHYHLNPPGIPNNVFPEFLTLAVQRKLVDKRITRIRVSVGGQVGADVRHNPNPTAEAPDLLAPFNLQVASLSGGVVNLSLNAVARNNLRNATPPATQHRRVEVFYTFEDGTNLEDIVNFGTNNNGFRPPPFVPGYQRIAADAGTFNILSTYEDFLIEIGQGETRQQALNNGSLRVNVYATRAQLSAVRKRLAAALEDPNGGGGHRYSADLTLVSATRLTVANSSATGHAAARAFIVGVYAR